MNKLTTALMVLLTLSSASAVNHTSNVSFYEDLDATIPYLNEFLYVDVQHQNCQSYYLGGINCTYDCRNGRYASGVATINAIPEGTVLDLVMLHPTSLDNLTSCPSIVNT